MGKKKIIIITGASSGLGQEFAFQLDKIMHRLDEVWLIARRKERLEELAKLLDTPAKIISMDVAKEQDNRAFKELLERENVSIRMLINCAGFGLMGRFEDLDMEEQIGMLEVNCKALTWLTYECIPYMCKNGRIIQLASSAAFAPQKNFAVYAATKSYVDSFSLALREELKDREIYVTSICPGPVDTPFFDIAERHGSTLSVKKLTLVTPERVVEQALRDACLKRPRSVCSWPIQAFGVLCKILPHPWITSVIRTLKG